MNSCARATRAARSMSASVMEDLTDEIAPAAIFSAIELQRVTLLRNDTNRIAQSVDLKRPNVDAI